jgi:type I restriction enzyme S subunit
LIYKDGGKPGYFIPNFSIFGEGFPYERMALNEHVFLLDFWNRGYNFFSYFFFQTEEIMRYLNAQGSKAAIPGINRNDVESIFIPTIDNKEVKEFCDIVEPIITAVLVNSKESSRLATLRDTLLPKLMNGEIKL